MQELRKLIGPTLAFERSERKTATITKKRCRLKVMHGSSITTIMTAQLQIKKQERTLMTSAVSLKDKIRVARLTEVTQSQPSQLWYHLRELIVQTIQECKEREAVINSSSIRPKVAIRCDSTQKSGMFNKKLV